MLLSGTLLTSDNQRIAYQHYTDNHSKVVIIIHGFYNSKDSVLLKQLAKNLWDKYDVFMFDFRGHGGSSGVFTWTSKEGDDLKAVLNYLAGKYEKTGAVAFSLGGSICINFLSKQKGVDSLICVSTPSDVEKVDYKFWELDWETDIVYSLLRKEGRQGKGVRIGPFWLEKDKPVDSVKKIEIPILYLHGDKDWVVEPWHSRVLYEETTSKKELVIIKDGPHAEYLMRKFSREILGWIEKWFTQTLGG